MKQAEYFLGADGGGTKTEFVLADANGRVLGHCRLTGSNPNDVGMNTTKQVLRQGIDTLCSGIPLDSVSFYAGIAGVGSGIAQEQMSAWAEQQGFACSGCRGDIDNILAAGLGTEDGIAVIMGTGFVAFGRKRDQGQPAWRRWQVGGWGSFFDDGGSGFHLGRDALYAVLTAWDGSGTACPLLCSLVEQQMGCSVVQAIPHIYQKGKDFVASFAPVVFEAARQGDAVAQNIVQRNIDEAARLIAVAVRQAGEPTRPFTVILAGGLTRSAAVEPLLRAALQRYDLPEAVALRTLALRPVYGALLCAGMPPSDTVAAFCKA